MLLPVRKTRSHFGSHITCHIVIIIIIHCAFISLPRLRALFTPIFKRPRYRLMPLLSPSMRGLAALLVTAASHTPLTRFGRHDQRESVIIARAAFRLSAVLINGHAYRAKGEVIVDTEYISRLVTARLQLSPPPIPRHTPNTAATSTATCCRAEDARRWYGRPNGAQCLARVSASSALPSGDIDMPRAFNAVEYRNAAATGRPALSTVIGAKPRASPLRRRHAAHANTRAAKSFERPAARFYHHIN